MRRNKKIIYLLEINLDQLIEENILNDQNEVFKIWRDAQPSANTTAELLLREHTNWSRKTVKSIVNESIYSQLGYWNEDQSSQPILASYNNKRLVNFFKCMMFENFDLGDQFSIKFMQCKFVKSNSKNCSFIRCRFEECVFENCSFYVSEFKYCEFIECVFIECKISNSKISHTGILNNCLFEKFELYATHLPNSVSINQCTMNSCSVSGSKYDFNAKIRRSTINECSLSGAIIENFSNNVNEISLLEIKGGCEIKKLRCENIDGYKIEGATILNVTSDVTRFINSENITSLTLSLGERGNKINFDNIKNIKYLKIIDTKGIELSLLNIGEIHNASIKTSKIALIKFTSIGKITKSTIDKYSFDKDITIVNGYNAVNGIVCQDMSDGYSNASIALVSESRADMGLVSDAGIVVDNLKHARHVFGVYLLLSGLGLLQLLKELGLPGFDKLKTFPVFGAEVCLPLESFLFITPLLIIIILIIKPIIDKAFEWAQYINDREKVTQITGFAWTLTQFEKPRSGKKTNKLKWIKITWSSLISYIVRGLMIFAGPAIYAALLHFLFKKEIANWLYIAHSISAGILLFSSILFFVSSQKFQKPLVFNPYDEQQ